MTPAEVRQWRESHKLPRVRLAELLPVSVQSVEAWEYGNRPIPKWLIRALRDIERELAEKSTDK